MLTKSDFKKLKETFVTKDQFVVSMSQLEEKFVTKNEFITAMDAIMNELKAIREEITINFYRRSENSKKIENHEDRITTVEEKLSF